MSDRTKSEASHRWRTRTSSDYARLSRKLFTRSLVLFLAVWGALFLIYRLWLNGRFAEMTVRFLSLFNGSYQKSLELYDRLVRNYEDFDFFLAVLILFLLLIRLYFRSFRKYFAEVERGIDSLAQERAEDVHLSPQLSGTEAKINAVRNTLNDRKAAADEAEMRKNELVVYLAHDLKTPLTSVIGYLNLLSERPDLPAEERAQYTGIALEKAQRLEALIGEFFEITQLNLTDIKLSCHQIDLSLMLEQILSEYQPILKQQRLSFTADIAPKIRICADPDRLERVFDNVIRNAVHYSYPDTEIHVTLKKDGAYACAVFANHGDTLSPNQLAKIFDQFYRADPSRSGLTGGAGLGLAISKRIVELHHGTIEAESKDQMIRMILRLPAGEI